MTKHLNEEQLIQYQFDLAGAEQMAEMKTHLDGCDTCRAKLEKLQGKFSSLELLRDEGGIEAGDDLIERTVSAATASKAGRSIRFGSPVWSAVGAVAAMILVVLFLRSGDFAGDEELAVPSDGRPSALKEEVAVESRTQKDMPVLKAKKTPAPQEMLVAMELADSDDMRANVKTAAIADVPPFAPASAIELVTLPRREGVEITIYNSADLTLVREKRSLTLKRGWNWLQFMWANTLIDPTSLSLEAMTDRSKIDIQQLVYPAGLKDIGRWLIRSEVEGQFPFEITYFTSGVTWRAFYEGTLAPDEQTMKLKGFVRVTNNSGEVYEDAKTRLIVGKVHILDEIAQLASRRYPYGRPGLERGYGGGVKFDDDAKDERELMLGRSILEDMPVIGARFRGFKPKEIKKEGLSEYFLYTIEGTETIANGWAKRLGSFEAEDVPVKSLYKYDEERYGSSTMRYVSFANDEEHKLGETPIPNGDVRIFRTNDAAGYLSYVGRSNAKYIPVNEEVELGLGAASNVKVVPILMNFTSENHRYDDDGNISGWDEVREWKITVTNTRLLGVDIEITRSFGTAYWDIDIDDGDVASKKHDATHQRFELTVSPRAKRTLDYTVRTYHGTRQQAWEK